MTETQSYQTRRYYERKNTGLCVDCGATPPETPYTRCRPCLEKRSGRDRAKRANSICRCGEPTDGHAACRRCLDREAATARARRDERRAKGLCHQCGQNSVSPPFTACTSCRKKSRRKEHNQRFGNGNRKATLERDSYRCRVCDSTKRLRIHHIDGDQSHNELSNFVTLCIACHKSIHSLLRYTTDIELLVRIIRQQVER